MHHLAPALCLLGAAVVSSTPLAPRGSGWSHGHVGGRPHWNPWNYWAWGVAPGEFKTVATGSSAVTSSASAVSAKESYHSSVLFTSTREYSSSAMLSAETVTESPTTTKVEEATPILSSTTHATSKSISTSSSFSAISSKLSSSTFISSVVSTKPQSTLSASISSVLSSSIHTSVTVLSTISETAQKTSITVSFSLSSSASHSSSTSAVIPTTAPVSTVSSTSPSVIPTTTSSISIQSTTSTEPASSSTPTSGLNYWAKKAGLKYFGTAEDIPGIEQQDAAYMSILNDTNEFGQLTPGNAMKWEFSEPTQGTFNFAPGDITLALASAHDQLVRCHNLVWHQELPTWVTSGNWTSETLSAAMQLHIHTLVTHWGAACYSWDVVNEPVDDDATMRKTIFYNVIGPGYVALAFQYAAEAVAATGKDIKLYLNDYNIEQRSAKQNATLALVQQIQAHPGARIDGVGLESHFIAGATPARISQTDAKNDFVALGLDVAITELDVRFLTLPATDAGIATQMNDYVHAVGSCLDVPRCVGVTIWDFDDKYSWIPYTFAGQGSADLWTNNTNGTLSKVPAYYGVLDLLYNATLV